MILDDIINYKREFFRKRINIKHPEKLMPGLMNIIKVSPKTRGFLRALSRDGINIIAEIKKASPSSGVIREKFDPLALAKEYENHVAAAISILTEEHYFQGNLASFQPIKDSISLPALRKDFLIEELDIYESRANGADCILLIARILETDALQKFYKLSKDLGMDVLVEIHDENDLEKAMTLEPDLIGINNRDLDTLKININTTLRLIKQIPDKTTVVSESGISKHKDIIRLRDAGVSAFLIGEALMRAEDIGAKIRELKGV